MRLRVSGDKSEIRQSYIPSLFPHLVQPLMEKGAVRYPRFSLAPCRTLTRASFVQSAVDDTIEFMDEYFLSREDWDTIVELGVGDNADALVLKKIPSATKTAFTKKCVFPRPCVHATSDTIDRDPPPAGTTRATTPSRSTRPRRWEKCQRSLQQRGLPQISKRRSM